VGYFDYLGRTNDARCTREIKCSIAITKTAFNSKKNLFTTKLKLNLKKKSHVWIADFKGAETWSLRTIDQKYPGNFEM
jgi:hypothetical protein